MVISITVMDWTDHYNHCLPHSHLWEFERSVSAGQPKHKANNAFLNQECKFYSRQMVVLEFLLIYQHPGLPPGLLEPRLSVFATFLPCCDKIPEQKQLEEMFILLPSLRGNKVHCEGRERHIISSGPSCGNRAYGNGDTAFRVRKQKEMLALSSLSHPSPFQSRTTPLHCGAAAHTQGVFLRWKHPHRHLEAFPWRF